MRMASYPGEKFTLISCHAVINIFGTQDSEIFGTFSCYLDKTS